MNSSRGAALFLIALSCLMTVSPPTHAFAAALGALPELDQDIKNDEDAALRDRQQQDSENNPPPVNFAQEYEKGMYGYGTGDNDQGRGANGSQMYSDSSTVIRHYASDPITGPHYLKVKDGTLSCKFEYNNNSQSSANNSPVQGQFTKATYTLPQQAERPANSILDALFVSFSQFAKPSRIEKPSSDFSLASLVPGLPGGLGAVVPGATGSMPAKIGELTAGTRSKPGQVLGMAQPALMAGNKIAQKIVQTRGQWQLDDPTQAVKARKKPQQQLNQGKPAGQIKDNDDDGNCQERAGQTGSCNGG